MTRIPSDLTQCELVTLLELIHASLKISKEEDLKALLSRVSKLIPCTNIVAGLGRIDSSRRFQGLVRGINVSYPLDWIKIYLEEGYAEVDPVFRSHFRQFTMQIWSETYDQVTSSREMQFIEHANSFGLYQGVTVGVVSEQEGAASLFSFAGPSMAENSRHSAVLEYLIPHFHLALMRVASHSSLNDFVLSTREREVLDWMKEGKTSWEISQILHISERTVNFHVQNILSKLQASTRGHAIALAMQRGLIGL